MITGFLGGPLWLLIQSRNSIKKRSCTHKTFKRWDEKVIKVALDPTYSPRRARHSRCDYNFGIPARAVHMPRLRRYLRLCSVNRLSKCLLDGVFESFRSTERAKILCRRCVCVRDERDHYLLLLQLILPKASEV